MTTILILNAVSSLLALPASRLLRVAEHRALRQAACSALRDPGTTAGFLSERTPLSLRLGNGRGRRHGVAAKDSRSERGRVCLRS